MARLISVPGLTSLLLVSSAREIDDLIAHPGLERRFVGEGRLVNRVLVAGLDRQMRHEGQVLTAFRPRDDADRVAAQHQLFTHLDRFADAGAWPPAPVTEMARYIVKGRHRRDAEAALAFAVAWPFLAQGPAAPQDDAYKPQGRHLWQLHRRTARARRPVSVSGLAYRLAGVDRRARSSILDLVGGNAYGLHAVEITLANAQVILENLRRIFAERRPHEPMSPRDLAWAAIRTAPEVVVRQTGASATTLPHVGERVPPHTIVLMRMRQSLAQASDRASGYEFASGHWSACPARRYVVGLFSAVAASAIDLGSGEGRA